MAVTKKKTTKKKAATKADDKPKNPYGLSDKHLAVLDLYRGGPDNLRGIGSLCWMQVYPKSSKRAAEVSFSDMLSKPESRAYLDDKAKALAAEADVTEGFVIQELLRLHKMCIGDLSIPVMGEQMDIDNGVVEKVTQYITKFDSAGAAKALELLGKSMKMFVDKVEAKVDETNTVIFRDFTGVEKETTNGKS